MISAKERTFSCWERTGRGFLGVLAIVFSLGIAIIYKPANNLFTKRKTKIRFAVAIPSSSEMQTNSVAIPSSSDIQKNQNVNLNSDANNKKEKLLLEILDLAHDNYENERTSKFDRKILAGHEIFRLLPNKKKMLSNFSEKRLHALYVSLFWDLGYFKYEKHSESLSLLFEEICNRNKDEWIKNTEKSCCIFHILNDRCKNKALEILPFNQLNFLFKHRNTPPMKKIY